MTGLESKRAAVPQASDASSPWLRRLAAAWIVVLAFGPDAFAGKGGTGHPAADATAHHRSTYAARAPRDAHGRIARDPRARNEFRRTHPCPATGETRGPCRGYVIDHVQPLKRGGPDTPANMQWQSRGEAKLKDRTE
jgi:hypothetical protein